MTKTFALDTMNAPLAQMMASPAAPRHPDSLLALPPGDQWVVLRGIAWAGKRTNVDEFCKPEELDSLLYPAGGPSRPADSLKQLVLHPEFKMTLVASEPLQVCGTQPRRQCQRPLHPLPLHCLGHRQGWVGRQALGGVGVQVEGVVVPADEPGEVARSAAEQSVQAARTDFNRANDLERSADEADADDGDAPGKRAPQLRDDGGGARPERRSGQAALLAAPGEVLDALARDAVYTIDGGKRLVIIDDLYDEFVAKFTAAMLDLPAEYPLSSQRAADTLNAQVDRAVAQGATFVTAGERHGAFVPAGVLSGVTAAADAYRQELFGPVAQVYRAATEAQAIEIANRQARA